MTLTLGPLTGVNRSDRTSSSSCSTGMFHTHADADSAVDSDADSLPEAAAAATGEALAAELELARRMLPRSLLRSSPAERPTLVGLQPTEADRCSKRLQRAMCVVFGLRGHLCSLRRP